MRDLFTTYAVYPKHTLRKIRVYLMKYSGSIIPFIVLDLWRLVANIHLTTTSPRLIRLLQCQLRVQKLCGFRRTFHLNAGALQHGRLEVG